MTVLWVPTVASPGWSLEGRNKWDSVTGVLRVDWIWVTKPPLAPTVPPKPLHHPPAEVCVTWFLPVSDFTSQLPS